MFIIIFKYCFTNTDGSDKALAVPTKVLVKLLSVAVYSKGKFRLKTLMASARETTVSALFLPICLCNLNDVT